MHRYIAIVLLTIFTSCNLMINYGSYKKGIDISMAMLEEDETHLEVLEVKKFLGLDTHPFYIFEIKEYSTKLLEEEPQKNYEDVQLSSIETPPDFRC